MIMKNIAESLFLINVLIVVFFALEIEKPKANFKYIENLLIFIFLLTLITYNSIKSWV